MKVSALNNKNSVEASDETTTISVCQIRRQELKNAAKGYEAILEVTNQTYSLVNLKTLSRFLVYANLNSIHNMTFG
jgi:hypothetical protein